MPKMECSISDGPPEDDRLDWDSDVEQTADWLVLKANMTINHISEHASFNQRDLIKLLKQMRDYIYDNQN